MDFQTKFENCLKKCIEKDRTIIEHLEQLHEEVDAYRSTSNVVKTGGTAAGAVGTAMIIGTVATAPFTAGLSLLYGVGGAVLTLGGGVTNIVTDYMDSNKTKEIMANIESIVESKRDSDNELKTQIENFGKIIEQLVTNGVPEDSAIMATLQGIANGSVDLIDADNNPNIISTLSFCARLHSYTLLMEKVESVAVRNIPILGRAIQISEKHLRAIYSFFGFAGQSGSIALQTLGKLSMASSVVFTVLDIGLVIRDWSHDHPTVEIIKHVQDQLREESAKLEELIEVINSLKERVWQISIDEKHSIVGSTDKFVQALYLLLQINLDESQKILSEYEIELPISLLDTREKLIRYLIQHKIAKSLYFDQIHTIMDQLINEKDQKSNPQIRSLYETISCEKIGNNGKEGEIKKQNSRDEQIINIGVINVYRNIIDTFVRRRFGALQLGDLSWVDRSAQIVHDYTESISIGSRNTIENTMIANIPEDSKYFDANALMYAMNIEVLKRSSVEHMCHLFDNYDTLVPNSSSPNTTPIRTVVELLNTERVYVDPQALVYWLTLERGDRTVFDRADSEVKTLLLGLYDKLGDWVHELKRLQK